MNKARRGLAPDQLKQPPSYVRTDKEAHHLPIEDDDHVNVNRATPTKVHGHLLLVRPAGRSRDLRAFDFLAISCQNLAATASHMHPTKGASILEIALQRETIPRP